MNKLNEETGNAGSGTQVIGVGEIRAVIRFNILKIALFTILAGIFVTAWMALKPDIFQSSATIAPLTEESKPSAALGALASFGFPVGGSTKLEEIEALFRSNDLTVRVFRNHDLWPTVFGSSYDPKAGKIRVGLRDRILYGREKHVVPTDWDAIRAANKSFNVSVNKKVGTLSIAFETLTPSGSAGIVKHYLEEGRNRLQEEALQRATKNKKFLEEQIAKSTDPVSRDRLYNMYSQEIEREMLAHNRTQFGFRIIDEPRIPDRKSRPERAWNITVASILAFIAGCMFYIVRKKRS